MKRNIDLNEISDGRLYSSGDMVKADCHDCAGCSACCRGMGDSIKLDPMDIWRLKKGVGKEFTALMEQEIELGIVDGMILPNVRMTPEGDVCPFLDVYGRCSIHAYRPGICRLFPLGRYYEENGIKYFIQIHECARKERGKINVLRRFFEAPYRADDENGFYEEFSVKMEEVRKKLDGLKDFS